MVQKNMFSFYFTWIDLYYTHTHTQIVFAALKKSLVNSSYCLVDCLRLLFLTAYCLCKSSSAVFCVFACCVSDWSSRGGGIRRKLLTAHTLCGCRGLRRHEVALAQARRKHQI